MLRFRDGAVRREHPEGVPSGRRCVRAGVPARYDPMSTSLQNRSAGATVTGAISDHCSPISWRDTCLWSSPGVSSRSGLSGRADRLGSFGSLQCQTPRRTRAAPEVVVFDTEVRNQTAGGAQRVTCAPSPDGCDFAFVIAPPAGGAIIGRA